MAPKPGIARMYFSMISSNATPPITTAPADTTFSASCAPSRNVMPWGGNANILIARSKDMKPSRNMRIARFPVVFRVLRKTVTKLDKTPATKPAPPAARADFHCLPTRLATRSIRLRSSGHNLS
ncbi:hypothetical protein D3C77_598380 [compost metagenome]